MSINKEDSYNSEVSKNTGLFSTLFWLGFIIYIASYTISTTDKVNYIICNVFQVIGLGLLIPSAFYTLQNKIRNQYLKTIFFIYILWSLGIVLRGFKFEYDFYKQLLFDTDSGLFLYLVPILIFYPLEPGYLKKIFSVIFIFSIFYFIYDILFIKQIFNPLNDSRSRDIIENFTLHLSLPSGFVLITYVYNNMKKNFLALITLVVTFILVVIRARRGLMLMSFSLLIFSYIIYQYANKAKVVNIIMSVFIMIFLGYFSVYIYQAQREETFGLITERFGQRTRNAVEEYFYQDLKLQDWILGKGINGEYFCPGVEEGIGRISIYRKVIETGYLQVILNGGIISWILFLLIAIPAVFKGLFRSKNVLSKAASIWIISFLLYMYPGTMNSFSLYYMLVWVSIGICFSDDIIKKDDEKLKLLFQNT